MLDEKRMLNLDTIEAQSAHALPDRMMPLVTVVISNVLNSNDINIEVKNNMVAVQVCAVVEAIDLEWFDGKSLTCDIVK